MSIPKEFKYSDEADFTSSFLVPLLRRIGFSIVVEYHGVQEFGKDLVFGEIDRFGQVAYHGLQAKYIDSLGQGESNKLIDDCREAFANPFSHPNTGANERISTFYVANGGAISPNARTNFFNSLSVPHGGHIRMLDGKTLVALDRWATLTRVQSIGEYLSGLRIELRYNRNMLGIITDRIREYLEDEKKPMPIERLRIAATSHYLQRPLLPTHIDTDALLNYVHLADTAVNGVLESIAGMRPKENKRHLSQQLLCGGSELERIGQALEVAIDTILASLGPLAAM